MRFSANIGVAITVFRGSTMVGLVDMTQNSAARAAAMKE